MTPDKEATPELPQDTVKIYRLNIYQAIPRIMDEIGFIEKGRKNPQQGYMFRGIDEVYQSAQKILAKWGVFIVPKVVEHKREERPTQKGGVLIYTILTVDHYFYAQDGSCVVARTIGEAMDSGDKSSNKAMSAAMKYAMLETFCIPTNEPKDTENDSPEPASKTQPPQHKEVRAPKVPVKSAKEGTNGQSAAQSSSPVPTGNPAVDTISGSTAKRVQKAVAALKLGSDTADKMDLRPGTIERGNFIREKNLAYISQVVGRPVSSVLTLKEEEGLQVALSAEAGEIPEQQV